MKLKLWSRPASIAFSFLFIAIMCFTLLPSPVQIGLLSFGGAGVASATAAESYTIELGASTLKARFPAARYSGTYDRTYFTYMSTDDSGTIYVNYFDHDSDSYGNPVSILTSVTPDAHRSPVLHIIPSGIYAGYILVAFNCNPLRVYRSPSAETIIGNWTQPTITVGNAIYPQFVDLGNGSQALFTMVSQDTNRYIVDYRISSDGGQTWGNATTVVDFGDNYWCYPTVTSSENAIHLAWNIAYSGYKDVYYAYSPDNLSTWRTQGNASSITLPIDSTEAEQVLDYDLEWVDDLQIDGSGSPVISFVEGVDATTGLAQWAHYHDSAWSIHSTGVNTLIYKSGIILAYNTGIFLDPNNTSHVYIGVKSGSSSNIQEWHTTDNGTTWAKVSDITNYTGLICDEPRPVVNYDTEFKLFYNIILYWDSNTVWGSIIHSYNLPDVLVRATGNTPQAYYNSSTPGWAFTLNGNPWVGYSNSAYYKSGGGYRFDDITIPHGADIIEARLIFVADTTRTETTVNSKIVGDKESDAAAFSDLADYQSRRGESVGGANNNLRTVEEVAWNNVGSWTAGYAYKSPDIVDVVNEIINDQETWASGNALALFWDDHDDNSTHSSSSYRWPKGSYESCAPVLVIEYDPTLVNSPLTYDFGVVDTSTTNWANSAEPSFPLTDGNCTGNVTSYSNSAQAITISIGNMTGGIQWTVGSSSGNNTFEMKAFRSGAYDFGSYDTWKYRKKFVLKHASGALTNYQINVTVNRSTGSDSSGVFYVSTDCQSDYDDLRFGNSTNGSLDYWIESGNTSTVSVWFEADSIATTDTTFYMYYGNDAAVAYSNMTNTFGSGKADDFEWGTNGTTLNTSGDGITWTHVLGYPAISTDYAYGDTRSAKFPAAAFSARATFPLTAGTNYSVREWVYKPAAQTFIYLGLHGDGVYQMYFYVFDSGGLIWYNNGTANSTGYYLPNDDWTLFEFNDIHWDAGNHTYDVWMDGVRIADNIGMRSNSGYNGSFYIGTGDTTSGHIVYFDDVAVRNWDSTAPTWESYSTQYGCIILSNTPQTFISTLGAGSSEMWEFVLYSPTYMSDPAQKTGIITMTTELEGAIAILTITADPKVPDISNTPSSWSVGVVQPSQTYWANGAEPGWPLSAGDCWGNLTNNSSFAVDISGNCTDMTGGATYNLVSGVPGADEFRMTLFKSGESDCTKQDYTTYTEVDTGGFITKTAGNITFTSMNDETSAYVVKDLGASYFSGNFRFYVDFRLSESHESVIVWAVGNSSENWYDIVQNDNNALGLSVSELTSYDINLQEIDGGTQYSGSAIEISLNTTYYLDIYRDESIGTYGNLTCVIYDSSAERATQTSAVGTTSLALHTSKKNFQYLYGISNFADSTVGEAVSTGWVSNLIMFPSLTVDGLILTNSAQSWITSLGVGISQLWELKFETWSSNSDGAEKTCIITFTAEAS